MDVFLLSIVISTNKTEAAVQDTNEGTLNVQWEDENFGESICNALKKEEVTYADGVVTRVIDSNSFETIECNIFGAPCKIIAMTRRKSDERGIVRSTKTR